MESIISRRLQIELSIVLLGWLLALTNSQSSDMKERDYLRTVTSNRRGNEGSVNAYIQKLIELKNNMKIFVEVSQDADGQP